MSSLIEAFNPESYYSDLGWHSKERVREQLDKLEELSPGTPESPNPEYWIIRGQVLFMIAQNAIEQFSRGKDGSGILTRASLDNLYYELDKREREKGFDLDYF